MFKAWPSHGLLTANHRFMPPDQPVAFGIVAVIARLGHKYDVEWVLDEAKRRLRSIFMASYELWSETYGYSSDLVEILSDDSWIEATNIILLIGDTDMLPVAIYQCCQLSSAPFKGTTRVDGTVETLDLPTLQLCFDARTKVIERQSKLNAETFRAGPSKSCRQKEECDKIIRVIYWARVSACPQIYLTGSLMDEEIGELITEFEVGKRICNLCAVALRQRDRDGRRAAWRDLPSITGVTVDN